MLRKYLITTIPFVVSKYFLSLLTFIVDFGVLRQTDNFISVTNLKSLPYTLESSECGKHQCDYGTSFSAPKKFLLYLEEDR